jgi:hypothetical protein
LNDGLSFAYKYDVLLEKGNKKYSRKENNKKIKLVAVRITNYTDYTLKVGEDINFYSGNKELIPIDPNIIKKEIKQYTGSYLLYLLLTPLKLHVTKTNELGYQTESYSIGYGIGPGVTLLNVAISGSANQKFADELNNYSIHGMELKKGETIYGIVGFRDLGYDPIKIQMEGNSNLMLSKQQ